MNIFVLDKDPCVAAEMQHSKHVVKMTLETAQLLSSAVRLRLDWRDAIGEAVVDGLYRVTHKNHPCTIWARETEANFLWLLRHGLHLGFEYTKRFGKLHKSETLMRTLVDPVVRSDIFNNLDKRKTPFAVCMPDEYKVRDDPVASYKNYYLGEKIPNLGVDKHVDPWYNTDTR